MSSLRNLYAIILAGDDDSQLGPLTRALSIPPMPQQYAFIAGEGSLLQQTVAPYATLLPPERIVVVAATKWQELARAQLRGWRGISVLARPANRGAAPDIMLALGSISDHDPQATVVVAPARHYLRRPSALVNSLIAAEPALASAPVILAGVPMNGKILGERLVVPGSRLSGQVLSVGRLVERWPARHAARFKACGALWDTSVFLARAATLRRLIAGKLANMLLPGPDHLGVVAIHGSGWSAWNSPEQVMESLREPHEIERLLSRIYQRQHGIDRVPTRRQFRYEAGRGRALGLCSPR